MTKLRKGTPVYYRDPETHTLCEGPVIAVKETHVEVYTGYSVICINLSDVRVVP